MMKLKRHICVVLESSEQGFDSAACTFGRMLNNPESNDILVLENA
jgi:hypothetical protein